MARVKLTEYATKRLLNPDYPGVSVDALDITSSLGGLSEGQRYVVKVDEGVKKRNKQGLVKTDISSNDISRALNSLRESGYKRFLIEPYIKHSKEAERYISIELIRDGYKVLYSRQGGVDVEASQESIFKTTLEFGIPKHKIKELIPNVDLGDLFATMSENNLSFLEINPFVVTSDKVYFLDAAAEVDSAKVNSLPAWMGEHLIERISTPIEKAVMELDASSPASLNLHTFNEQGSILTLLSGGGASLVVLDSLYGEQLHNEVINYSEYSGAPTADEMHRYTDLLLSLLKDSQSKQKVVLIAGGVSNFTDVLETFTGIVRALEDNVTWLKTDSVSICLRRGGPNLKAGLKLIEEFLDRNGLVGKLHGPEFSLGDIGVEIRTLL